MKRNKPVFETVRHRMWQTTFMFIVISFFATCKNINNYIDAVPSYLSNPYHPEKNKWLDWNVSFLAGTSSTQIDRTMDSIRKKISDYYAAIIPKPEIEIYSFSCPCDPTMINITVTPIFASGTVPIPPPPPGRGVGGSGDQLDFVSTNNQIAIEQDSVSEHLNLQAGDKVVLKNGPVVDSRILAVMDTGLDTLFFKDHFSGLLWSAPNEATLRNFVFYKNGMPYEYYEDDDKYKHGTAATTLALQAIERVSEAENKKPKIMVLKVLDSDRAGSAFSVSCGLSYIIQKQATLANASLGYYGAKDSLMEKYVNLAASSQVPISIIAAAGNTRGTHDYSKLCDPPGPGNQLTDANLFFPGCFSAANTNVITVTTLNNETTSCFYQNYSNVYVNIGVLLNPSGNCCRFIVPYNDLGYEGSSFATPVVSGKIMGCMLANPGDKAQDCLNKVSTRPPSIPPSPATKEGRFLKYTTP